MSRDGSVCWSTGPGTEQALDTCGMNECGMAPHVLSAFPYTLYASYFLVLIELYATPPQIHMLMC